jgi:hypothetical protein
MDDQQTESQLAKKQVFAKQNHGYRLVAGSFEQSRVEAQ